VASPKLASRAAALAGVAALLTVLSFTAAQWCLTRGYTLYYGDAEAHLNIARRILDSRTPGPEQIGTVWLPLPHLLMLPFVMRDEWWKNGVAGVIPSAICFVLAGTFLFAAARRAYASTSAAFAVALLFALNLNLLYLQSTPMTEPLFLAALAALLWATLWFRDSQSVLAVVAAAVASNAASLTRYEGWFLVPFVCLYFLVAGRRKWHAILFGGLAALGPLAWLAHNQYYFSNALEFYNGPWSAMAIYRRQLAGGMTPYPGDHHWHNALRYYLAAARLTAGPLLLLLGAAGAAIAAFRRIVWPVALLALTPIFYIWSIHSSGTPIFVPDLWPFSWYNTRYTIAVLPLAAFAAGVFASPKRWGALILAIVVVVGSGVFLPRAFSSVCWKEAEVNSEGRRDWTHQAAEFLAHNYEPGAGILYSFGDLTGVLREAGIPLREGLHDGNHPQWDAVMARPDLALHEEWALAFSGDQVATLLLRAGLLKTGGVHYQLRKQIMVKGAPVVEIYRREP
jgi:Dolichyl-phosphate-mannose-protein mannosyltransferase